MNGFMTTKEAAEKWDISIRQVQNHCRNRRIIGVQCISGIYLIPEDAKKPMYGYIYETEHNSANT